MRRTRHVVLPVRSWQYMGLMMVSLACLTLGLVSRDREGRSGSLAGPELMHTAPHEVDACPNTHPLIRLPPYDETASLKVLSDEPGHDVRSSVRSRISSDSRSATDRMSRARSIDRRVETSRTSHDRHFDLQNRRTVSIDRRSRSIGMDRSSSSRISQLAERRENPGSISRERRMENINRQQINTDRRARSIEIPFVRAADEEKQRLILRSQDHRFTDEVVRSRSHERRSVDRRSDAADRRHRSDLSRRIARSVSERDARDVRLVRISRSDRQSENRGRQLIENIRSNARSFDNNRRDIRRINDYSEDRQNRHVARLSRSRSEDVVREDIRELGIRSQERRSSDRQVINPDERQEIRTNVLSRSRDVRMSRSRDVQMSRSRHIHRAESNIREGLRSDARRSSKSGETNRTGRQERRTDILRQPRDVRQSRSRDVSREAARSDERRSSEHREIKTLERQERRTNILASLRDVRRLEARDVSQVDVRRGADQSDERTRTTDQRMTNSVELREIRNNILSRSRDIGLSRSRDANRADVRRVVDQSEESRRTNDRRVTNPVGRHENRINSLSRSRDVRLSRSRDADRVDVRRVVDQSEERRRTTDQRVRNSVERREDRINSLTRSRDVRLYRSRDADRGDVRRVVDHSEERRRTSDRRIINPVERRDNHVNILSRSRDAHLSRSRDINRSDVSQLEKRSAERKTSENREMSPVERQERRTNVLARSRDIRMARSRDIARRHSRRENSRSQERRSSERRDISRVEHPERRVNILATSGDVRRIQSRDMDRSDVRRSREVRRSSERRDSLLTTSENVNHGDARRTDILLHRSAIEQRNNNAVQREKRINILASRDVGRLDVVRTGYPSRHRSVEQEVRQTSWVDSLRRNSENRERLVAFSRERRISRDITVSRISTVNSQARVVNFRNARVMNSENREHRGRSLERNIHEQRRTSTQEHRTSVANDRISGGSKRTANEMRIKRGGYNREVRSERRQMISTNILTSENIGGMFKGEMEYLRQAVILALCAVYSASLFKGKGGFYGFRNILAYTSRFVTW